MVTLQITNHNVHRVLINTRSSVDMLFCLAYNQMRLPPTLLKLTDTPLYGFVGHSVQLYGKVKLLFMAGSHSAQVTILTNFLIVDTPIAYNAIIKRPTLNALRVVTSTYHLALKFPMLAEVGVVHGNQVRSSLLLYFGPEGTT